MRRMTVAVLVYAAVLTMPGAANAAEGDATLQRYARDTWASFVAMTDEHSGLPADVLEGDGRRSVQTSTTNIGAYMWSAVAAERLGIITRAELVARAGQTIGTLERMERHAPSGQFYNWYDHRDGAKLTKWPPTGADLDPILSSVDNGWLATGLRIVARRVPAARRARARDLRLDGLRLLLRAGQNRILFHYSPAHGHRPVLLRHRRLREPDRRLHRHRQGRAPAQGVLRALAHVPGLLRLVLAGDAPERLQPQLRRRQRLRGQLSVRRARGSRRAGAARCSRR